MPTRGPHSYKHEHLSGFRWWAPSLFLAGLGIYLLILRDLPLLEGLAVMVLGGAAFCVFHFHGKPDFKTSRHRADDSEEKNRRKENTPQEKFREQEIRIREIHHRIKNQFQVISSLLSLQARHIDDQDAREAIKKTQDRVKSMALIHEKLYGPKKSGIIDMGDYIRSLASYLLQSSEINGSRIRLDISMPPIMLDMKTAVPCGLIFNELITNALKYAFPDQRTGSITIRCTRDETGRFEMSVADDGIGIPEGIRMSHPETMGLQLVSMLVEQLGGSIEIERKPNTRFQIRFQEQREKSP